jgi:hypothetical protein
MLNTLHKIETHLARENAVEDCSDRDNKRRKRLPRFYDSQRKRRKTTESLPLQVQEIIIDGVEYVWKQPRGQRKGQWRTVSGADGAEPWERLEPFELLSFVSSDLAIVVRPNLDWLPITLRWNESRDLFEGFDQLDEMNKLEVPSNSVIDMVCNPPNKRGQGRLERGYRI